LLFGSTNTRTPTDDFTKELSYLVEEAKLNNIFQVKYIQREVVSLLKINYLSVFIAIKNFNSLKYT